MPIIKVHALIIQKGKTNRRIPLFNRYTIQKKRLISEAFGVMFLLNKRSYKL